MAGVFVGAILADVSLAAIMQKIFDGVDSEALLAIPSSCWSGELMKSANVVVRIANRRYRWSATSGAGFAGLVVFSMILLGNVGLTTADVAVMTPRWAGR